MQSSLDTQEVAQDFRSELATLGSEIVPHLDARYTIVPLPILRSRMLTSTAKIVLIELMHTARREPTHNQHSGKMRKKDLATLTGITTRTVHRVIKELTLLGLVTKYSLNDEFSLFNKMELTYEMLYSIQPSKIDDVEIRKKFAYYSKLKRLSQDH